MSQVRTQHYAPSVRPANTRGKQGAELFITLRTRNCEHKERTGGCKFCGLGGLDGKHKPLGPADSRRQMLNFYREFLASGQDPKRILKASFIGMTDSLLSPRTIRLDALKEAARISRSNLPGVVEVGIESRLDMIRPPRLETAGFFLRGMFGEDVVLEVVGGIETPYEDKRNSIGKDLDDGKVEKGATAAARAGWNLRSYFIYNLLSREDNAGELRDGVEYMARLRDKTRVVPSILVLRGYVPEGYGNRPLFVGFQDVPDEIALRDLREAALRAKQLGVKFEIDSTSEDQTATGASTLSNAYTEALARYNLTFNPDELVLKANR